MRDRSSSFDGLTMRTMASSSSTSQSRSKQRKMVAEATEKLINLITDSAHETKSSFVNAQRVCPDLVNDEHLEGFLHVENYDAKLAATRLVLYWESRLKIFGPVKCYLPMTLQGAMRDDLAALKLGSKILLPHKDDLGRAIFYSKRCKVRIINEDGDQLEQLRVWWYILHVAMEDPISKKNGFVVLSDTRDATLHNLDMKGCIGISRSHGYMPIQWKLTHICHSTLCRIFPIISTRLQVIFTKKVCSSFCMHNGSPAQVLNTLAQKHVPRNCVPVGLDGDLQFSIHDFIMSRVIKEQDNTAAAALTSQVKVFSINPERCLSSNYHQEQITSSRNNMTSCESSVTDYPAKISAGKEGEVKIKAEEQLRSVELLHCLPSKPSSHSGKTLGRIENNAEKIKGGSHNGSSQNVNSQLEPPPPHNGTEHSNNNKKYPAKSLHVSQANTNNQLLPNAQQHTPLPESTQLCNNTAKSKNHPGRGGDARMKNAVRLRQCMPHLPLADALLKGGFVFPGLDEPGVCKRSVKDVNGVTMHQRKNQLLRRLRAERKKGDGSAAF